MIKFNIPKDFFIMWGWWLFGCIIFAFVTGDVYPILFSLMGYPAAYYVGFKEGNKKENEDFKITHNE